MSKSRTVKLRAIWIGLLIALVFTAALSACGSGSSQPTQAPPPATVPASVAPAIDGAQLLDTRCSVCHSADRPRGVKKTQAEWDQTVSRMITKGAQLTGAEKSALVQYLATTYGQ